MSVVGRRAMMVQKYVFHVKSRIPRLTNLEATRSLFSSNFPADHRVRQIMEAEVRTLTDCSATGSVLHCSLAALEVIYEISALISSMQIDVWYGGAYAAQPRSRISPRSATRPCPRDQHCYWSLNHSHFAVPGMYSRRTLGYLLRAPWRCAALWKLVLRLYEPAYAPQRAAPDGAAT